MYHNNINQKYGIMVIVNGINQYLMIDHEQIGYIFPTLGYLILYGRFLDWRWQLDFICEAYEFSVCHFISFKITQVVAEDF